MVKSSKTKKLGFSLAEALISMLILSVFFVATSKIMTHRQPRETQENPHGYFECYKDATTGKLNQKVANDLYSGDPKEVDKCEFDPPSGLAYAIIYAMPNAQRVIMSVEPQFNVRISVTEAELSKFHEQLDLSAENELAPADLSAYLKKSYPTSDVQSLIENGNYAGPALIIGW